MRYFLLFVFILAQYASSAEEAGKLRLEYKSLSDKVIRLSLFDNSVYSISVGGSFFSNGMYYTDYDNTVYLMDVYDNVPLVFWREEKNSYFIKGYDFLAGKKFVLDSLLTGMDGLPRIPDPDPREKYFKELAEKKLDKNVTQKIKEGTYRAVTYVDSPVNIYFDLKIGAKSYEYSTKEIPLTKGTYQLIGEYILFYDQTFNLIFWGKIGNEKTIHGINLPVGGPKKFIKLE